MPARASVWIAVVAVATLFGAGWALMAAPASAGTPTPEVATDSDATRVMFVGDSITGSPGCWRADVWVALSDAGYDVDMVGSLTEDQCGGVTDAEGIAWDPDHLGIGGITAVRMNNKVALESTLTTFEPDVVVLMIGTNDVRAGASADDVMAQYDVFLAQLRQHRPDLGLVIARMLPIGPDDCADCQPVVDDINARLAPWAAANTSDAAVIVVAATDQGFDVDVDTRDHLHPNAAGDAKVAAAVAPALMEALDARESAFSVPTWMFVAGVVPLLLAIAGVYLFRHRIRGALQD